jgi:nicotinamide-nucleotide amidase
VIAEIICVGNELLTGLIENSNSGYLARRLNAIGIAVREVSVIADQDLVIKNTLAKALSKSDLVIITGGLGPTEDDLTREAVASYLKRKLVLNETWLQLMEGFFTARGVTMPVNNRKQAMVIEGSKLLVNERGTAPGSYIEDQGKLIVILPGPPNEMQYMFENSVLPQIKNNNSGVISLVKTLKCIGIGESMLEEKIKASGLWNYTPLSYVSRGFEVDLQLKASGTLQDAETLLAEEEAVIRQILGDAIFGTDDQTLEEVVADLLRAKNKTLAVAESCSGGHLSDRITDIAGSSEYFKGGIVAYSIDSKQKLLGLSLEQLNKDGVVSENTAVAMAKAARERFSSDYGVGITGLAGPGGDQSEKPVGLVYIAAGNQTKTLMREYTFGGGRRAVKERSAQIALSLLRILLLGQ